MAIVIKKEALYFKSKMQHTSSKTILLIDDDESILQIVEVCLESFSNWRPTSVTCAKEGLAAIGINPPDAILLDMMMPKMDGFTFLKNLQSDPRLAHIPVVLLTARADLIEAKKVRQMGIKGAIVKPFHPIKLFPEIAKILDWQLQSP